MMPRLDGGVLVVDGTGMLVRCSLASKRTLTELTTSDGVPTGALMMFIGMLSRKLRVLAPAYAVVAWDGPGARHWRREIYPEYKGGRPSLSSGSSSHYGLEAALARDFCTAAGIRQLMVPGFEADDVIASVHRSVVTTMPGTPVIIASDDADLLQLLHGHDTVATRLKDEVIITDEDVISEWGVYPPHLPRLRALAGDSSDNIPGLGGVGPRAAVKMLRKNGGLWPLSEAILPLPSSRERVEAYRKVMDLISPPFRPEEADAVPAGYFTVQGQAEWRPGSPGKLTEFLERHELSKLSERLRKGTLW